MTTCPDCGVAPGEQHLPGCDVARCKQCGGQLLSCGHDAEAVPWDGEWPGVAVCRALGWWTRFGPNGWERCGPDDEGAMPDLNRLAVEGGRNAS